MCRGPRGEGGADREAGTRERRRETNGHTWLGGVPGSKGGEVWAAWRGWGGGVDFGAGDW